MAITAATGFVPCNFIPMLRDYFAAQGIAAPPLLEHEIATLKPYQQSFPLDRWAVLLQQAADQLDDPQLGLHLGATAGPQHLGVLGYVLLACRSTGAALLRLQQYQKLVYDATPMEVRSNGGRIQLVWDAEHGRPGALSDETGITALVQLCRGMIDGKPPQPSKVMFINPKPDNTQAYTDWFGCPVLFDQAETLVEIDSTFLAAPLKPAERDLAGIFEQQAQQLLKQHPAQSETVNQVQQIIARQLHWEEPTLASVASQLHLSTRTLHRKLATHQTNFNALLAKTRLQLAAQYLANPSLQLAEISGLLAYSEQSAFNRSFKRWTNNTPRRYRQQIVA